jgi:hypothetical protein
MTSCRLASRSGLSSRCSSNNSIIVVITVSHVSRQDLFAKKKKTNHAHVQRCLEATTVDTQILATKGQVLKVAVSGVSAFVSA